MLTYSDFSIDYFEPKKIFKKTIIFVRNYLFKTSKILKGLKIYDLLTLVSGNLSQMKEQVLNWWNISNFD